MRPPSVQEVETLYEVMPSWMVDLLAAKHGSIFLSVPVRRRWWHALSRRPRRTELVRFDLFDRTSSNP